MLRETALPSSPSRLLISAALLGVALIGVSSAHGQEAPIASEIQAGAQNGTKSIQQSDTSRVPPKVGDTDGDGRSDTAQVGRRADLKKLADELVNKHQPGDEGTQDDPVSTAKVDAGNALNARAANARAGDPIPGIDITVNQGAAPEAESNPAAEPVPALDANPTP